ncbi:GMC oxidoreductase [Ruegeria arenilitoris]|uniref:GMC oxidoreductase n=1 Tax=Ruegeria arenilitoris TaxID=1173585 RepID=UPI00147DDB67|nr:GMC family oxidoreductase [Ruegeria arenilitoris]
MSIEEILSKTWDAIVIGTGIGGGTIGRRLAEAGAKVLFVEYGPYGPSTEEQDGYPVGDEYSRMLHGIWPSDASITSNGETTSVDFGIGAGVGGTSSFYASTLERPAPEDIDETDSRPHPTGGWPVKYAEFDRYFAEAEHLYHVVGERNPVEPSGKNAIAPPKQDTEYQKKLRQFFQTYGLNPYRSPTGAKFLDNCKMCFGRKCPRGCKMDGRTAGVDPALATGNAELLDWCEAVRFHGTTDAIDQLEVRCKGKTFLLNAKVFILSAGALNSPRILQRSISEYWPNGCANGSGLLGQNLMFHLNEFFAVWSGLHHDGSEYSKTFSMKDFYTSGQFRLGVFQALGVSADYRTISHFLSQSVEKGSSLKQTFKHHSTHFVSTIAAKVLGNAELYVGILEDFPNTENHVANGGERTDQIKVVYNVSDELLSRRAVFTKMINEALPRRRRLHLNRLPQINHAHACGTARFGDDAGASVLDRNCRAHDLHNLFCVDSSFMPTSNGVNPSLTIAANALRVGDHIIENALFST